MIYVIFGEDRVKAQAEIKRVLGEDYEVVEGEEVDLNAARDIFLGTSLFGKRKIVVKGLKKQEDIYEMLDDFVGTENDVVLWEEGFNKNTKIYKNLKKLQKNGKVDLKEFAQKEKVDRNLAFNIYDVALKDGKKAVEMLAPIEMEQAPQQFIGVLAYKAIQQYTFRYGAKEKRVLLELSKLDMQLKQTTAVKQPWTLVKSFLLRMSLM